MIHERTNGSETYFSVSSTVTPSILVLGRSEFGPPRALIIAGRALVFPPVAAPGAVPIVDAPFSLPPGIVEPPLPAGG